MLVVNQPFICTPKHKERRPVQHDTPHLNLHPLHSCAPVSRPPLQMLNKYFFNRLCRCRRCRRCSCCRSRCCRLCRCRVPLAVSQTSQCLYDFYLNGRRTDHTLFIYKYICKLVSLPAQAFALHLHLLFACTSRRRTLRAKTTDAHGITYNPAILVYRSPRTDERTPPTNSLSPFSNPRTNYLPKNYPSKLPPEKLPLQQRSCVTCNNIFSNSALTGKLPFHQTTYEGELPRPEEFPIHKLPAFYHHFSLSKIIFIFNIFRKCRGC